MGVLRGRHMASPSAASGQSNVWLATNHPRCKRPADTVRHIAHDQRSCCHRADFLNRRLGGRRFSAGLARVGSTWPLNELVSWLCGLAPGRVAAAATWGTSRVSARVETSGSTAQASLVRSGHRAGGSDSDSKVCAEWEAPELRV